MAGMVIFLSHLSDYTTESSFAGNRITRTRVLKEKCSHVIEFGWFSLFFTGTRMLLGSKKNQCTTGGSSATHSGSLPDTASRKAVAVASDGSLGKRYSSKGTSRSKEIQAQGILKPKISVSRSLCNITASSRTPLEENVPRENQLLKSKVQILLWLSGIWFQ